MVDIPRKRQRDEFSDRNRGLFKYVDTVEDDNFFKDPSNAQHLQVILSRRCGTRPNLITGRSPEQNKLPE